jgi:uncharacterized OsmC-like protein
MRYSLRAGTLGNGVSVAYTKDEAIRFDSSPGQSPTLPGPADLLTAAFAACVLKNVERMSELLPFAFRSASIEVTSERQDRPPKITTIRYRLTVVTDEPPGRVRLLHENIQRHGTIFNTLADACEVTGEIAAVAPASLPTL